MTMLAFAVTSLDSATKTLVSDSTRIISESSSNKTTSQARILHSVTYSTMGIMGVLNIILLITGFPRVFTIVCCLVFVPFFVRAIVYSFRFATGKIDYSKSGTISVEEYKVISNKRDDVKRLDQTTISYDNIQDEPKI